MLCISSPGLIYVIIGSCTIWPHSSPNPLITYFCHHQPVLCICELVVISFRFHMYVRSSSISLSLSFLFHLVFSCGTRQSNWIKQKSIKNNSREVCVLFNNFLPRLAWTQIKTKNNEANNTRLKSRSVESRAHSHHHCSMILCLLGAWPGTWYSKCIFVA